MPGTRYAIYVIGVFALANTFNFLDRQLLAILLVPIKDELGASDAEMGFLSGFAFALFYTFAGIPIARWADRGTRRSIMAGGIALWSGMTAVCGLARSFWQLAGARVGVGVGEAALTPAAHSMISDYFTPRHRATALAVLTMGAHVGVILGMGIGGAIVDHWGWRAAFFIAGAPGLLVALLVRLTVREPLRGQSEGIVAAPEVEPLGTVLRTLWRLRTFRHLALGASLQAFFGYGFLAWAPTFMMRVHDMSPGEVGLPLGLILGLGGLTGALVSGGMSDRLARRDPRWYVWLPALTAVAMIPFALLFLYWPTAMAAMLFFAPAVCLGNFYPPPIYALTQGLVGARMRGIAASILLLVINLIGLGLGPWLVGVLNDALNAQFGAHAIRYSLAIIGLSNIWAAAHFVRAARSVRAELRTVVS